MSPRIPSPPSRFFLCCALVLGPALAPSLRAAGDLRFSVSLDAADRTACGLHRLTSDQVAVLDALVRLDTMRLGSSSPPPPASGDNAEDRPAATFSQRLTGRERETAGLAALTTMERERLDANVERHQNARLARTLLSPPSHVPRRERVTVTERRKEREIHGSFSLSYGMGSGGYREMSGSMVLTLDDPQRGYSVAIGYTETHTKGGVPYYLSRDPILERGIRPLDDPFRP